MATINDIDTTAVVSKFLQRRIITPTTDDEADTSEETQALLETIATSFLLFPQAALPIILRAKNALRQIVQADLDALDFLIGALGEVQNPDTVVGDVSDLVEAQTALVELDRLGRVSEDIQAFQRYRDAVGRFLDNELAGQLKRNAKREFERSGSEARTDIFSFLPRFEAAHGVMMSRLSDVQGAVSDFRSVDLNQIVSARTIRVLRSSLRQIKERSKRNTISKTVSAIELLGGLASLEAISETLDIYDPTISTTDEIPPSRVVTVQFEEAAAFALSSEGPWDASGSNRVFALEVNPLSDSPSSFELEIPYTGVKDASNDAAAYVTTSAESAQATYTIPAEGTLYIQLVGAPTPENQEININPGGPEDDMTAEEIKNAINLSLTNATCIVFGTNRLLIYGTHVDITEIIIHGSCAGEFVSGGSGYNSDPSVHDIIGFDAEQTSLTKGWFNAETLADALINRVIGASIEVEGEYLRIVSGSTRPDSSLEFDDGVVGAVQDVFGFDGIIESQPSYAELVEDGSALIPEDENVFVGSIVTAAEDAISGSDIRTLNNEAVTYVSGTKLYFAQASLPRGSEIDVIVVAPDVVAVQNLVRVLAPYVDSFEGDIQDLQLALSPILSRPTPAQVNDALGVLNGIRDNLDNVLSDLDTIVVQPDRSPFFWESEAILRSLEERGLDKAQDFLSTGRFSDFFLLTKNTASRSGYLLNTMENFVVNAIPMSYDEEVIEDDQRPLASNEELPLDEIEPAEEDDGLIEEFD